MSRQPSRRLERRYAKHCLSVNLVPASADILCKRRVLSSPGVDSVQPSMRYISRRRERASVVSYRMPLLTHDG